MMWRDIAYLINKNNKKRLVYCNEKSIRQSEFYQAGLLDIKPELMLEVRAEEYNANNGTSEVFLEYKNIKYVIYRTYQNREITELYLTVKAGEL